MIVLLYGPDDYRRETKRKELVADFLKKHSGLGFGSFDCAAEDGPSSFQDFVKNQSIFEPLKLVVLENALPSNETEKPSKEFAALLKGLSGRQDITVLITHPKKPTRAFDFLLKPPAVAQSFEHLDGPAWKAFVKREAARRGVKLAGAALDFLAETYHRDGWRLATELEKMSSLGGAAVEKKDLENLGLELAPDFWGLLNGLKSRNIAERLGTLELFFETNDPAPKLFNILAYQLPEKTAAIAAYDLAIKSGKLDYEEALLDLAMR